jgi:hypothetical protein
LELLFSTARARVMEGLHGELRGNVQIFDF